MSNQDFVTFFRPLFDRVLRLNQCGYTQTQIAALLSREGWRSQRGNRLDQVTVHRILKEAKAQTGTQNESHLVAVSDFPPYIQREIELVENWRCEMFAELEAKQERIKNMVEEWQNPPKEEEPSGPLGYALHRVNQAN